jgi:hypothetical protein
VFLTPLLAVTAIARQTTRRHWLSFLGGIVSGLAVYLYLPLAQLTGEPSPWGRLDTVDAWTGYVSAAPYHSYLFTLPVSDALGRLLAVPGLIWNEFTPFGMALALLGAWSAWRQSHRETIALGVCVMFSVAFSIGYNTADAFRYLTIAWLAIAIWMGEGVRMLATVARRRATWGMALLVAWLALTGFTLATRWNSMDASDDTTAATVTERTLAGLPQGGVLITRTDRQTFALWYYIDALHMRPDALVVDQDLFTYAPYRAYLAARWHHPALAGESLGVWLDAQRDRPVYFIDAEGNVRPVNAREIDAETR